MLALPKKFIKNNSELSFSSVQVRDETALKTSLLVGETNTKIFFLVETPSLYGWSHSEFLAGILTPFIFLIFNHIAIHLPKKNL